MPPAGDAIAAAAHMIEVHVASLRQLLNEMDSAPFHNRDLDPRAEEFIYKNSPMSDAPRQDGRSPDLRA